MDGGSLRDTLPIPTYEEAIASRPSSSQSFLGSSEVSHDAERQGLLRQSSGSTPRGYRPPTVESARSSMDFLGDGNSSRDSAEGLRREMSELEVLDPPQQSQMSQLISKRISSLTSGLSSLNTSFRNYLPSVTVRNFRFPPMPEALKPSWMLAVRFFALMLVLSVGYLLFFSDLLHFRSRGGSPVDLSVVRRHILMHLNETKIRDNLEHVTRYDHMAGTEGAFFLAKWLQGEMEFAGLEDVELEQFDVYLNYPKAGGRSVSIVDPIEKAWEARIEEELAYVDPPRQQTPVFHGYSKSGDVEGHLIYANYGSREDFTTLGNMGINVTGAIVLVRYYGTQTDRALKVKAAELAGAAGCIIYSDPKEDGFVNGPEYPDGPWRPNDSVQRGTVGLTSWVTGDPLSPGFASLPSESNRISKDDNPGLVNIPSIPLAWRDASALLHALQGTGEKLTDDAWTGGVPEVEYWTGSSSKPVTVRLQNEQDEIERQPIHNVLGRIEGLEQPEKTVTVGNHYDAWCFGGSDPGSGTAVFVEMVRIFGELKLRGWRPRRTIEFAAWDAEEYNLVGSTEHVEARLDSQRASGFAYINVDVAVGGHDFHAAGSPFMLRALERSLNRVGDPSDPTGARTMRAAWVEAKQRMEPLGAGSDYVAFQDLAGTSSIDLSFSGSSHVYHSCYDSFEWMTAFGDPDFRYHRAVAQLWALLIVELADEPLLPLDLEAYAGYMDTYINVLEAFGSDAAREPSQSLDLSALRQAQRDLRSRADQLTGYEERWYQSIEATGGFESTIMTLDRLEFNSKLAEFETDLLDLEVDLPSRPQYKHVIFAPEVWSGYDGALFPGPRDAIEAGNWTRAQEAADRAAAVIAAAVEKLVF